MMRKNSASVTAATLLLAVTLVACGGGDGATSDESPKKFVIGKCGLPAGPLAVAISRRANNPGDIPAQVSQIVQKFITDIPAMVTGPTLSLINIDGRSDVYRTGQFYSDSRNKYGLPSDQRQFLAGFHNAVTSMRATEPEVDILTALEEAGAAAGRPGPGTVVLVDSGLSTLGALDFSQPNVLDAPVDELITFLRNGRQVPDLRGLTIIFIGIGEVARPQQKLGTRKAHLIEL
jgi:OOP family OmpA-OmpF porin